MYLTIYVAWSHVTIADSKELQAVIFYLEYQDVSYTLVNDCDQTFALTSDNKRIVAATDQQTIGGFDEIVDWVRQQ